MKTEDQWTENNLKLLIISRKNYCFLFFINYLVYAQLVIN